MFRVGMKVIAVNDPWLGWRNWLKEKLHPFDSPKIGDVLTICNVIPGDDFYGESLEFSEFPSPQNKHWGAGFLASGFRPLVERKTDISIFTKMLTGNRENINA